MSDDGQHLTFARNRLLASLTPADLAFLRPHLRSARVDRDQEVHGPGDPIRQIYFPASGLVSMVAMLRSGRAVEVGTVTRDGVTGVPLYPGSRNPPYRVNGQIPGEGWFLDAARYHELHASSQSFRVAVERHLHQLVTLMTQTAACNGTHDVPQRLAKWLLISQDAAESPEIALTQESLAIMIGVQRPTVTLAAGEFQRDGLISYRRGKIHISDRAGIEKRACECYETIRSEHGVTAQVPTAV